MSVAGNPVTGSLGSAIRSIASGWYQPFGNSLFNIFVTGTFSATVALVRSFDGGGTWVPVALPSLSGPATITVPDSLQAIESDASVLWTLSCLAADGGAWVSGTVNFRIG